MSGAPSEAVPRRTTVLFVAAVVAVVGVTSLITLFFASWRPVIDYSDFAQDYVAAKAWGDGLDPYANTPDLIRRYERGVVQALPDRHHDPHTPFQILLARPFDALGFREASSLWLGVNTIALVAGLFLVLRALPVPRALAWIVPVGALALPTVRLALANGEPNAIALLLLVVAWRSLRAGNESLGGLFLGIATALRVFPIFLLIPLLRQKRYRAVAWDLGSAAIVTVTTGLTLGISATKTFITSAASDNFRYWRSAGHNISLLAIPFRWLTRSHWFPHSANAPTIAAVLAVIILITCIAGATVTPARASKDLFWAVVPWSILASPLAWADYLVLLLPLIVIVAVHSSGLRRVMLIIPVAAVMIGRPFFVHAVNPVSALKQALVLSIPLYGLLAFGLLEWARADPAPRPV